jgi:hypothetical protein
MNRPNERNADFGLTPERDRLKDAGELILLPISRERTKQH